MKDIFTTLSVLFPVRFYQYQKNKFLFFFSEQLKEMNYSFYLKTLQKNRTLTGKCRYMVVGDLENAEKIIITGYDTPVSSMRFRTHYNPVSSSYRQDMMLEMIIRTVASATALIALYLLLFKAGFTSVWDQKIRMVILLTGIVFLIRFALGLANRNNYNKNTSGLAVVLKLLIEMKDRKNSNVCFVLADKCADRSEGLALIGDYIEKNNRKAETIVIDSVGFGKRVYCASLMEYHSPITDQTNYFENFKVTGEKAELSSLKLLPRCSYIICGRPGKDGDITIDNVRSFKDDKVDTDLLEKVADELGIYLQK